MKEDIYNKIAKILSREDTSQISELKQWLSKKPSHKIIFNALKFQWLRPKKDREDSGERIFARINSRIQTDTVKLHPEDTGKSFWGNYGIAAAIVIFLGLGLIAYQFTKSNTKESTVALREKVTPQGQKTTFVLNDGTTIKLNSASSVKFPSEFDQNKREIFLEGEAFFDVARDVERPFIVYTGSLETTVLGTSFNVKAHPNQDEIEVSVVSGKVKVESNIDTEETNRHQITLEPNEMATYNKDQNRIIKNSFNSEEITGWKDGVLVLKNADLSQIKRSLEDWYGVKIQYANARLQDGDDITANYYNEPLENVLVSLGYTLQFEYNINHQNVEIRFLNLQNKTE